MIKARIKNTFILGLTEENVQRLKKDQPIKFNLRDLDPTLDKDVIIMYAKDDSEYAKLFIDHVGPDTKLEV